MDGEAVVDANWKTNIDACLEFYHGYYIHPEITPMVETYRVQYDLYDRGISRMIIPFGYAPEKLDDTETINEGLKQMVRQYDGNPDAFAHLTVAPFKTATIETNSNSDRQAGITYFQGFTVHK